MNNPMQTVLNVVGRIMLILIFFMSAVGNKIPKFTQVTEYMASAGVPAPSVMLVGAIVFLIVGSVFVAIGFQARIGAVLLIVFLALATWFFHDFWTFDPDSKEYQAQMIQFMKNLGLAGAMFMILANGPGPGSLDHRNTSRSVERDEVR